MNSMNSMLINTLILKEQSDTNIINEPPFYTIAPLYEILMSRNVLWYNLSCKWLQNYNTK
jgi:hypothetical protein